MRSIDIERMFADAGRPLDAAVSENIGAAQRLCIALNSTRERVGNAFFSGMVSCGMGAIPNNTRRAFNQTTGANGGIYAGSE